MFTTNFILVIWILRTPTTLALRSRFAPLSVHLGDLPCNSLFLKTFQGAGRKAEALSNNDCTSSTNNIHFSRFKDRNRSRAFAKKQPFHQAITTLSEGSLRDRDNKQSGERVSEVPAKVSFSKSTTSSFIKSSERAPTKSNSKISSLNEEKTDDNDNGNFLKNRLMKAATAVIEPAKDAEKLKYKKWKSSTQNQQTSLSKEKQLSAEERSTTLQQSTNPISSSGSNDEEEDLLDLSSLFQILDLKTRKGLNNSDGSSSGSRNSVPAAFRGVGGLILQERHAQKSDSMSTSLQRNDYRNPKRGGKPSSYDEADQPYVPAIRNVAILFGKSLVRDQITVEYASRIRKLVTLLAQNNDHDDYYCPSLICFTGNVSALDNRVSDADAGCVFFRHLCETQNVDLNGVDIFIDSKSIDEKESMQSIMSYIENDGPLVDWFAVEEANKKRAAGFSREERDQQMSPQYQQKQLSIHFTLISTDYHLCNINDVHHRSPRQSLRNIMKSLEDAMKKERERGYGSTSYGRHSSSSQSDYYGGDDYNDADDEVVRYPGRGSGDRTSRKRNKLQGLMNKAINPGIVRTSWSFQYATYPYNCSKDDAAVFLGKCYLLGEELTPLLVNMKGVVKKTEFFQRDNYLMLASIRQSLVSYVEELHRENRDLKPIINQMSQRRERIRRPSSKTKSDFYYGDALNKLGLGVKDKDDRPVDIVLDGALLSLGRCVELVRPAGLFVSSVSKSDWVKALRELEHSMSEIREVCDPDRPLPPSDWGKLEDNDNIFIAPKNKINRRKHHDDAINTNDDAFDENYDSQIDSIF